MQSQKAGDWNVSTKPIRGSNIYVAFPGLGKTTYALHHPGVVDLDFGSFRSALGVAPARQSTIYSAFVKFANTYTKGGFIVLTNEPALIPLFKQDGYKIVVCLPENVDAIVKRVIDRHSNPAFDRIFSENAAKWSDDWAKIAKRYGAQIVYQKSFSVEVSNGSEKSEAK